MKQITNSEYKDYLDYKKSKIHGRILTPDGLRFICNSYNNDPIAIGTHFLETLHRFESESAFSEKSIF